jgi:putative MATE family efflux protein
VTASASAPRPVSLLAAPPLARPSAPPSLWKAFLLFLGPMVAANVLQSLSGTVNNIYLGQMIGVGAFAAVSAFFPVLFFFISFILGLGTGASILIGQAYGAGAHDKVKAVAGTAITVTVLAGLAVTLAGAPFAHGLLAALGTPADILPDATAYARVILIGMPLLFAFLLITAILRGVGDTVTPLLALALSTAIGLLLTPALIRGWAGLPKLGVVSGAYAAIVSFVVTFAWLAIYLRRRAHPLAPDAVLARHLWVDPAILKSVLRLGVPSGVGIVLFSVAEVVVLSLVNGFGSEATAAYGTITQVLGYVQFPAMSIAIAASILGAQAIGAGHADRLGAIVRTGLVLNLVCTGGIVLLVYACSGTIIGFFLTSAPVAALAQELLRIMLWSIVLFGMAGVLSGVMRASGAVMVPMMISIISIALIEVPVAYVLSRRIGLDGIWVAYPVAFLSMLVMQAAYYQLVWRKRAIRRLI